MKKPGATTRSGTHFLAALRGCQRAAHPRPDVGYDLAAACTAFADGGLVRTFCRRLVPIGTVFSGGRIPRDRAILGMSRYGIQQN